MDRFLSAVCVDYKLSFLNIKRNLKAVENIRLTGEAIFHMIFFKKSVQSSL